jgi:hypothetical protein
MALYYIVCSGLISSDIVIGEKREGDAWSCHDNFGNLISGD